MSDNHETTENKIGVGNDIHETSINSNSMNDASARGSGKGNKDVIHIWPSLVVVLLYFTAWIFFYHSDFKLLTLLCIILFLAFCIISSIVFLLKKKFKKSLSFALPGLLLGILIMFPPLILKPLFISRDHVAFLMHKKEIISNLNRLKWPEYKEWEFGGYTIIYDLHDEVIKKKYGRASLHEEHTLPLLQTVWMRTEKRTVIATALILSTRLKDIFT